MVRELRPFVAVAASSPKGLKTEVEAISGQGAAKPLRRHGRDLGAGSTEWLSRVCLKPGRCEARGLKTAQWMSNGALAAAVKALP